jgi:hypothetical protein
MTARVFLVALLLATRGPGVPSHLHGEGIGAQQLPAKIDVR